MSKDFEEIISKNIAKWERLDKRLASERLAKQLIKKKTKTKV